MEDVEDKLLEIIQCLPTSQLEVIYRILELHGDLSGALIVANEVVRRLESKRQTDVVQEKETDSPTGD